MMSIHTYLTFQASKLLTITSTTAIKQRIHVYQCPCLSTGPCVSSQPYINTVGPCPGAGPSATAAATDVSLCHCNGPRDLCWPGDRDPAAPGQDSGACTGLDQPLWRGETNTWLQIEIDLQDRHGQVNLQAIQNFGSKILQDMQIFVGRKAWIWKIRMMETNGWTQIKRKDQQG
jgi:hypothetical protein